MVLVRPRKYYEKIPRKYSEKTKEILLPELGQMVLVVLVRIRPRECFVRAPAFVTTATIKGLPPQCKTKQYKTQIHKYINVQIHKYINV